MAQGPRRQAQPLLHGQARELLLRLRQAAADQGVRRRHRAPRRAAGLHDDRPQAAGARAQGDRRQPRRARTAPAIVTIDPKNGYIRRWRRRALRQVEVQPRRPGPPPARLDVQGHGADDRAAPGRRPEPHDATSRAAEARRLPVGARSRSRPTRHSYGGSMNLVTGDAAVRQLGLRAARPRPRPGEGAKTARDMGITSPLDGYPAEALGGLTTASRRWRWRAPTRRSPTAATATGPIAITQGRLPRRPRRRPRQADAATKVFADGVTYEATKILEENIQGGTGTRRRSAARRPARPARPTTSPTPGSSASRRACHRGLGRLPEGPRIRSAPARQGGTFAGRSGAST